MTDIIQYQKIATFMTYKAYTSTKINTRPDLL